MGSWNIEHHNSVELLTYSNPPHNLLTITSLLELGDIFERLAEETDRVKVVVLAGGRDGFFIDHLDITGRPDWFKVDSEGKWHTAEFEALLDVFHGLEEIPQPTIAAIDGLAAGGGSEIALSCTIRVGSPRAHLQQSEILAGVIPGGGGTVRLPRLVGPGVAAEVILTGRVFEADEALRAGWINAMLPAEDFIDHSLRWVERIAQNSGPALIAAKNSLKDSLRLPFHSAIAREREIILRHMESTPLITGKAQKVES
jgi:enoyl-CoA hydratase